MQESAAFEIESTSSIESEPMTLHLHEIQIAREAALYVLNTKTIEEAVRIFTEGLEPVVNVSHEEEAMDSGDEWDECDEWDESDEWDEWDFFAPHPTLPEVFVPLFRDAVTAPF